MKSALSTLLLPFLLMSLMLAGCASAPDLRVGIATNYPPVAFMEQGVLKGVEPELAQHLSELTGRKVVFDIQPFDQLIPLLQQGRIDVVMSGMSDTPERRKLVSFSDAYLRIGQMLLIREQDVRKFPKALFDRSAGVRIGVERGTTGEAYVLKSFAWGSITHFATTEEAVAALEQRSIDCFVHDAPTIWRFSANTTTQRPGLAGFYEPLTDEPLAWAVRKADTDLLARLNAALAEMKRDGTLHRILVRWVPTQIAVGQNGSATPPLPSKGQ